MGVFAGGPGCVRVADEESGKSRPFCELAIAVSLQRRSRMSEAAAGLATATAYLSNDGEALGGQYDCPDPERRIGHALAVIRHAAEQLADDSDLLPGVELVERDDLVKSVIEALDREVFAGGADAVSLFEQATVAVNAISGGGWLIVRALDDPSPADAARAEAVTSDA